MEVPKVALLIIATGKYDVFIPPLLESARAFFLPQCDLQFVLFSDRAWPPDDDLTVVPQEHRPWPFPALHRFHSYLSQRVALQTFQYVFSIDADMLFVDTVGDEVLEDLVAVLHPAFLSERGTPETNPESVAFIVALGTSVRSAARVNARITDHIGLTRPFQVYLGMYLNFFFLNVFFF